MVNREYFKTEIPKLYPLTIEYDTFWSREIQRCIEGYWVSGTWMPGKLYFYINYVTIKLNIPGSKVKTYGHPWLRDIEWEVFYNWEEARGFSGFEDDPTFTCNVNVLDKELTNEELISEYCLDEKGAVDPVKYSNLFTTAGKRKEYMEAREYMRLEHYGNLGRPLYYNQSQNFIMLGARGYGKDLQKDTKLYLEDREIPIKDVQIGDKIFNHLGDLVEVTNKFKFTDQVQYELELADGRKISSGLGHKWEVWERKKNKGFIPSVKELKDIILDYNKGSRGDSRYFIRLTKPVKYSYKDVKIDPYTLGAILGDGGITQRVTFTTEDKEILNYFKLPEGNLIVNNKEKFSYAIVGKDKGINPLTEHLRSYNLFGKKSDEKFIPNDYLYGSIDQRLELLRGLMDTDGSISKKGQIELSLSNEVMINQVKKLCESLGIRCSISKRKTTHKDSYRLNIITSEPIFKLKRKLDRINTTPSSYANTNRKYVAIRNIVKKEVEDSYCISVDGPDNLFLAEGYIPTHNSYTVAGLIAHEFIFDGRASYAELNLKTSATVVMGAGDSKYSSETLSKVKVIMDMLPGDIQVGNKYFPSPLRKQYKGSFDTGSEIVSVYKVKQDGEWRDLGTSSTIKHRTFRDNAFAANGIRSSILVFEEIGMFNNLKASYVASVETQRDGKDKFGSMFMIGTGGDMNGGGTLDAYEMFYNPTSYDALTFEDTWEFRGKIGFFIPAYLGLNQFKNENGYTDESKALKYLIQVREKLGKGKASTALEGEIINRPVKPSEIFLVKHGNMFPIMELQDRLSTLRNYKDIDYNRIVVDLFYSNKNSAINGIGYKVDVEGLLTPIEVFPYKDTGSREGAVVIYELPETDGEGKVPEDLYIIGHDPYRTDSPTGPSLATIFVLKTKKYATKYGHDEIVAVYRGRPYNGRNVVNEILLKLSLFYGNAKVFFENEVGNVKEYFEKKKKLHLLATQPTTILTKRATQQTKQTQTVYGYPMSNRKFKMEGVQYLRDWLLDVRGEINGVEVRNLDKINDQALLQELISFNLDGNFDSVMGFMGCIFGMEEHYNKFEESLSNVRTTIDDSMDFFANHSMFRTNNHLPNGGHNGIINKKINNIFDV